MADLTWNNIRPNFSGSNQALANAQRGLGLASRQANQITEQIAKEDAAKNALLQQDVENERAGTRLELAQQTARNAQTTFDQGQTDRAANLTAQGVNLQDVGFTQETPTDVVTSTPKSQAEIDALISEREQAAYAVDQSSPEYANIMQEIIQLQQTPDPGPQNPDVWNQFMEGVRPEGSKYSGEMKAPAPAPTTERVDVSAGLQDIDARRLRGEISDTEAIAERSALIKSRGVNEGNRRDQLRTVAEPNELEIQKARQKATANSKKDARLEELGKKLNQNVLDIDKKVMNMLSKDDITKKEITSVNQTVAKDRANIVKELRKAFKDQLPEGTKMTPEVKAAINTRLEKRLEEFDSQAAALDKIQQEFNLYSQKQKVSGDIKQENALTLLLIKDKLKKKEPLSAAEEKIYAGATGTKARIGAQWFKSDEDEGALAEANALLDAKFRRDTASSR